MADGAHPDHDGREHDAREHGAPDLSRREAVRRVALIGGALFVVPAVQTISMRAASAQRPSGGDGDHIERHRR